MGLSLGHSIVLADPRFHVLPVSSYDDGWERMTCIDESGFAII